MSDYFIENKDKINTVLEQGTSLEGELFFLSSLKIRGKFKGSIVSEGLLVVDQGAALEADIKAKDVVIAGQVKGNIIATNKLEIESSGKLYGDIKTGKLKIADGVFFEGNCEMMDQKEIDTFTNEVKTLCEQIVPKPKTLPLAEKPKGKSV